MRDERGWTLLHFAAHYGMLSVLKYLISRGHSFKALSHENKTPFDVVSQHGNTREFLHKTMLSDLSNKNVEVADRYNTSATHNTTAHNTNVSEAQREREHEE